MKFKTAVLLTIITISILLNKIVVAPVMAEDAGPVNPFSFSVASGATIGSVKLTWYDDGTAGSYNLFYGQNKNNLNYGVVGIGYAKYQTNEFTVGYLDPGATYYFKLIGKRGSDDAVSGPISTDATSSTTPKTTYFSESKNYQMPYLFSLSYVSSGTINVNWFADDTADKYDIVYGTDPGNFSYGVENIPYQSNLSNSFPVGALTPGRTYYFSLVAERNNKTVSWSMPLSINVR